MSTRWRATGRSSILTRMSPPAAAVLEPPPFTAAERRAAILALPLRDEPETDEERAIFDQAQAALREGRRGHTTEEVLSAIDVMHDHAAE